MSTAEPFLYPEELDEFIRETLADDNLYVFGEEDAMLGLCPFVSFYIYHGPDAYLDVADRMISVHEAFEALIDEPFQLIWKDNTQVWLKAGDRRLPTDLRAAARKSHAKGEMFKLGATDRHTETTSARWAVSATVDEIGIMQYSRLKLTFRLKWYRNNRERWHAFVRHCLHTLQPEHCYSGFEVGNGGFNILGAYEVDTLERQCADHLYGMDIDHPADMCFHSFRAHKGDALFAPELVKDTPSAVDRVNPSNLGAGLRTPTWCFLLAPFWRRKLGLSEAQVRAALDDPRIDIAAIEYATGPHNPDGEPALWIHLGELDLHPVERGVPELLVKASALIRPIRCDGLNLVTFATWDDDPNPRFDFDSARRWMARFDPDSDWPDAARRNPGGPAHRNNVPAGQP